MEGDANGRANKPPPDLKKHEKLTDITNRLLRRDTDKKSKVLVLVGGSFCVWRRPRIPAAKSFCRAPARPCGRRNTRTALSSSLKTRAASPLSEYPGCWTASDSSWTQMVVSLPHPKTVLRNSC